MIRKISDIVKEKERTFSFEFFPPKTEEGRRKLPEIVAAYMELKPDWLAVTYGAGGTTREWTTPIVDDLQRRFDVPVMHHLTCIGNTKAHLHDILVTLKSNGICNILALRGDPPKDTDFFVSPPGVMEYSYQLVNLIHSFGRFFSIGVAGFPEGHPRAPNKEMDAEYLKMKLDCGGEFVVTQLFYNNRDYFEYVKRLRRIGVNVRVIPGILPITNFQLLVKITGNCGASIPNEVYDRFKALDGDDAASYRAGVEFAVRQCNELLEGGAPGLHFFTMNKINPVMEIMRRIRR